MSTSISFQLPDDIRTLFDVDPKEFCSKLQSEIESVLRSRPHFFRYDCNDARGEIQDDTIVIEDLEIDALGNGEATYRVTEHVHMGCSDLDCDSEHDGQLSFTYERLSGSVVIPYREIQERPPDEF
ncbi:MAG: hypothetical protein RL088_820 [Verrucomicrobiota bacterium]|jgi:hypothetical protein